MALEAAPPSLSPSSIDTLGCDAYIFPWPWIRADVLDTFRRTSETRARNARRFSRRNFRRHAHQHSLPRSPRERAVGPVAGRRIQSGIHSLDRSLSRPQRRQHGRRIRARKGGAIRCPVVGAVRDLGDAPRLASSGRRNRNAGPADRMRVVWLPFLSRRPPRTGNLR